MVPATVAVPVAHLTNIIIAIMTITIIATMAITSHVPGKAITAALSVVCAAANPLVATIAAYSCIICQRSAALCAQDATVAIPVATAPATCTKAYQVIAATTPHTTGATKDQLSAINLPAAIAPSTTAFTVNRRPLKAIWTFCTKALNPCVFAIEFIFCNIPSDAIKA